MAHAQNHYMQPCAPLKLALNETLTYKDVVFANIKGGIWVIGFLDMLCDYICTFLYFEMKLLNGIVLKG